MSSVPLAKIRRSCKRRLNRTETVLSEAPCLNRHAALEIPPNSLQNSSKIPPKSLQIPYKIPTKSLQNPFKIPPKSLQIPGSRAVNAKQSPFPAMMTPLYEL